jgi:hypothetical protein
MWFTMEAKLPPPDPHETLGLQPAGDTRLQAPTAVFVLGAPSPQTDRVADAMLELRPGLLLLFDDS